MKADSATFRLDLSSFLSGIFLALICHNPAPSLPSYLLSANFVPVFSPPQTPIVYHNEHEQAFHMTSQYVKLKRISISDIRFGPTGSPVCRMTYREHAPRSQTTKPFALI